MQQPIKLGPGEAPGKGDHSLLIAALERQQAVLGLAKIGEVVGGPDLALADRKVDLHLVKPGGMDRKMHQPQGRPVPLEPVDRCLPPRWELPLSTTQNTRAAEA
jgi:hypothetical protein